MTNTTLKSSLIISITALVFLFIVNFFDIAYPIRVQSTASSIDFSVVGEGKIEVKPDIASVNIGVSVQRLATASEVEKKINEINNNLVKVIQAMGVKAEDISTSNYSFNPDYTYSPEGKATATTYSGNSTLTVKVRDLSKVGEILQQATANGATNVDGSNFYVEKPELAREQARDLAINNAKAQAEKLANKLGIRLGKITNIVESSSGSDFVPMGYKTMALTAESGGQTANLQPGSQTITSTVTLYFEKK